MVLMKKQERDQLAAMRQQCGQERDLQVKQVEGGFVIQGVVRFFTTGDDGGPFQVGEVSDTSVAVSAIEAGLIARNFIVHGEFWPDGVSMVVDEQHPDAWAGEAKGDPHAYNPMLDDDEPEVLAEGLKDPVMEATMPELQARTPPEWAAPRTRPDEKDSDDG